MSNQGIVRSKAVLTFANNTTVEVYGTDYIKSWKLAQDLSSSNDKPVFDFVSDRLDMTLYSLDNDFNPFAEGSQYYGRFVIGTKIDLYVKVDYLGQGDELNWDSLGKFKIVDINVSETGTECEILDKSHAVLVLVFDVDVNVSIDCLSFEIPCDKTAYPC